jgi:outer membrane protein OmpA-like peptidoglycan-associated protein
MNYILANGISRNRLKAIGYGETKLVNNCGNDIECSEEEHKINRRTEFIIKDKATD